MEIEEKAQSKKWNFLEGVVELNKKIEEKNVRRKHSTRRSGKISDVDSEEGSPADDYMQESVRISSNELEEVRHEILQYMGEMTERLIFNTCTPSIRYLDI